MYYYDDMHTWDSDSDNETFLSAGSKKKGSGRKSSASKKSAEVGSPGKTVAEKAEKSKRVATGFALYVKKHYHAKKARHPTARNADIMRLLAADYRAGKSPSSPKRRASKPASPKKAISKRKSSRKPSK